MKNNTAAGDAFDGETMEISEMVVGKEDAVVVEVAVKGYRIGDTVVRRARVKVSATEETMKKAQEEEKEEEEKGEEKEAEAGSLEEEGKQ